MSQHFDIVILGAGPGGYVSAIKAVQMGANVAVVEKSHLGGTCLNNGCIPSKALLASAELLYRVACAGNLGVTVEGQVTFDWDKIQTRKDKVIETLRGGIKNLFRARKVTLFQGQAQLDGPGKIVVTNDDGEKQEITSEKIILAVGSKPARIPGWPDDPELVCTSDESLHWKKLPKSLLIVGGGVIGCEFACMMVQFGVEVTIVEMLDRLLPNMDSQLGTGLEKIFKKRGIKCFTGTKIDDLARAPDGIKARLSDGQTIQAQKALVATGRRPNTSGLGLDSIGLTTDHGFIRVNDYMETPINGYYCIGDANGRCLLAHAASAQGIVAVKNALGEKMKFDAPIPEAVYTFPEIASVGMTEERARAEGISISVGNFPIGFLGKAMAVNDTEGFFKVIRNRETDRLMGVQILGHNATECIAAAGALLHTKVTVNEMADIIVAHPTISEALKESAEDALHMAIHLPPRSHASRSIMTNMSFKDFLPAHDEMTRLAREGLGSDCRFKVNSHIHLPPNFSAFENIRQVVDLAVEQQIGVLGVSNYYDFDIYGDFVRLIRPHGIFPLFGLEIIVLIDDLVRSGVKVNDPGNPGKMYICGKGITQFDPMTEKARELMDIIRRNDKHRIAKMIGKLVEIFQSRGLTTSLDEDKIIDITARHYNCSRENVYLQERHVARVFQEALFDRLAPESRTEKLNKIMGAASGAKPDDAVKIQNEIRSNLMKSGKDAFVKEEFISFDQAYQLILELGGIPCYPTLADGVVPLCEYEEPVEKLIENLQAANIHCVEFIPIRNTQEVLTRYVKAMRKAGLIVLAGTEHNTLEMLSLEPTCLNGQPIPQEIREIFWQGACVVAGHQFMRFHNRCGFVDSKGDLNPEYKDNEQRIDAFRTLGASVIQRYNQNANKQENKTR